jgi:ABC-type transport system involved in cytochrome c biogenesis permease component
MIKLLTSVQLSNLGSTHAHLQVLLRLSYLLSLERLYQQPIDDGSRSIPAGRKTN